MLSFFFFFLFLFPRFSESVLCRSFIKLPISKASFSAAVYYLLTIKSIAIG